MADAPSAFLLEHAWDAARRSHDVRERLWASALEDLAALTGADIALAFGVGPDERRIPRLARTRARVPLPAFVANVAARDPVDPFAVTRARERQATVCGHSPQAVRSLYGRRLARDGLRLPLFTYLWSEGAISAGIALGRIAPKPEFGAGEVGMLERMQPLLQEALSASTRAPRPRSAPLTAREQEVANLVALGSSNAMIAGALGMRETTVKAHLTHVYNKLHVRSRTELAARLASTQHQTPVQHAG